MRDDEAREVRVHRIELLVVDHDDLGADEVREVLESARYPNRCIAPEVMDVETRTVLWDDGHPLNRADTQAEAYRALFGGAESEEAG